MKKKCFLFLATMIIMTISGCGSPPLALPEQGAKPVEQEPVSSTNVAVAENFSSPLAPPTPTATKITKVVQPDSTPEVIPTLSGPFPSGPKVVYYESIRDNGVTFWAASPINPAYRTPLAKGSDPNFFGINAALSPDGKMIAYTALPEWNTNYRLAADLWLVTTDGNEQRLLAEGVDLGGPGYPYWSPDSRYIAFVRSSERSTETEDIYETTVWMIDIITGKETKVKHPGDKKSAWPVGWVSDGAGFYYRSRGDVYFFSIETNTSTFSVSLPASTLGCNLSPDSTQILCSVLTDRKQGIYELITLSLQDKESLEVIRQFQGRNYTAIWGPRDQSITISENFPAAESTILQIVESNTKNAMDVKLQAAGNYFPLSWSPDGTWLVAQSVSEVHGDLYFFSSNKAVNHLPTQSYTDVLGWLTVDLSSR